MRWLISVILALMLASFPSNASRLFDDAGSDEYLSNANAIVSATPFTLVGWFRGNDGAATGTVISIGDTAGAQDEFNLQGDGTATNNEIAFYARRATTSTAFTINSVGYVVDVWAHTSGRSASATSRFVTINGADEGASTSSKVPVGLDTTRIGVRTRSSTGDFMSGDLAEVAIWSISLTDADILSLAKGASPLMVRPDSLVSYWPIWGDASPENDIVGSFNMTVNGTPTKSVHPRIYYPE